ARKVVVDGVDEQAEGGRCDARVESEASVQSADEPARDGRIPLFFDETDPLSYIHCGIVALLETCRRRHEVLRLAQLGVNLRTLVAEPKPLRPRQGPCAVGGRERGGRVGARAPV